MSKRPRGTGSIHSVPGSKNLWVGYPGANGEYIRESSGSANRTEAQKFLRKRMEAVSGGSFLGPRIERITVDELYSLVLQDYGVHGQQVKWPERVWKNHLKAYFGGMRASRVGTAQIGGYVERRLAEKDKSGNFPAKATINRELALLRRAFSLGYDSEPQMVVRVPKFHKHIVSERGNEREGFVEQAQYAKLADKAAGQLWLRGLLALGYSFGFRVGELLEMRRRQVDLLNRSLKLKAGTTKNGEPRTVALTNECFELVKELCRGKGPDDSLFTREDGEQVRDFRGTWAKLIEAAGIPGLLFHDLRRSAVRNMIRRGVPQKVARSISGHKTDSVFERYDITSGDDLTEAARKIEEGARAALQGEIHSSFIVGPQNEADSRKENAPKPS